MNALNILSRSGKVLDEFGVIRSFRSQVRRFPRLSHDEEREVVRAYQQEGDKDALERLVHANLWVVLKIVQEYPARHIGTLDQIQEGCVGLMQAIEKFDVERGIRLSTYAQFWVRAVVLKQLMSGYRIVRLGTTVAQRRLFFRLKKEKKALMRDGIEPTPEALAERLDVTVDEVVEMDMRMSSPAMRLDAPLDAEGDSGRSLIDHMTDTTPSADRLLTHKQLIETFRDELDQMKNSLKPRERDILAFRLLSDDPMTLQSLGDRFGVSRERARQIEARLLKKIRARLEQRMDESPNFYPARETFPSFSSHAA